MYKVALLALLVAVLNVVTADPGEPPCMLPVQFTEDVSSLDGFSGDVLVKNDATVQVQDGAKHSIVPNGELANWDVDFQYVTDGDSMTAMLFFFPGRFYCGDVKRQEPVCQTGTITNERTGESEEIDICLVDSDYWAAQVTLLCGDPAITAAQGDGRLTYDFGDELRVQAELSVPDGNVAPVDSCDVPPPIGKEAFGTELILDLMLDKALTTVFEGLVELRSHLEYVDQNLPVWEEMAGEDYDYPFIGLNRIAESTWDFFLCLTDDPCACEENPMDFCGDSVEFQETLLVAPL